MIKVQDWIASIPDSDKHVAYVGEGKSEQREFLLCGADWANYTDFTFYLDMAFDPTSITTHDNRQVVQTTHNSTASKEEGGTIVDEVTTKETYTVDNVQITNHDLTDIAPLDKATTAEGIRLTWTILRQHTVLPGKLRATIRAVDHETQMVKKSAIMTFEVDAAICAVPATVPPVSEVEQMEARIGKLYQQTQLAAAEAADHAATATDAADTAIRSATTAVTASTAALGNMEMANTAATEARESADTAVSYANMAASCAAQAQTAADTASTGAASAVISVQGAAQHSSAAQTAAEQCDLYARRCEEAAKRAEAASGGGGGGDGIIEYNRVNVRDYGAVGDGVTDDRRAIIEAFEAAKAKLPCEVYFPAGTYAFDNGITIEMPYGSGGLRVCGAGRELSILKYSERYSPDVTGDATHWYAIRIWPVGMPKAKPTSEDEYLHDISFTGLTVHDPDPIAHAWHLDKGDPDQEETHGFDLHYCKGAAVTDCQFITVGDEAIDICASHDVVVMNNRVIGSPGAGPGGGAISINDGCNGVVVSGNTINGSAPDEVLDNGTVITKKNNGITVESLSLPVKNVTIVGNSIRNMHGVGVKLYDTVEGTGVDNVIVAENVISGCDYGIIAEGTILKSGLNIHNNVITDCTANGMNMIGISDMTVCGNTFRNIGADRAIKANTHCDTSTQLYADNLFENLAFGAMYVQGNVTIKDCVFHGVGVTENIPAEKTEYGIYNYGGDLVVSGCVMKDVRSAVLKAGISRNYRNGTLRIDHTDIELVNASGVANAGGDAVTVGGSICGGVMGGRVGIKQENAIVQGVTVVSTNIDGNGITVAANGVSVTGCNVNINAYNAIKEDAGCNYSLIANNIVNRAIVTVGPQSIAVNNIDTRVTA